MDYISVEQRPFRMFRDVSVAVSAQCQTVLNIGDASTASASLDFVNISRDDGAESVNLRLARTRREDNAPSLVPSSHLALTLR